MAKSVEISREEITAKLKAISSPKLDAFRARVPSLLTSDLIAFVSNPDGAQLDRQVLDDDDDDDEPEMGVTKNAEMAVMAAAMIAVCDEIDLRIPVRKP